MFFWIFHFTIFFSFLCKLQEGLVAVQVSFFFTKDTQAFFLLFFQGRGGIGRRVGLRVQCISMYGFKSRRPLI